MERIYQLIYDRSHHNTFLSKNDIYKIIGIIIEYKKLDSYVNDVYYTKLQEQYIASYSDKNRIIAIYYKNLEKKILDYYKIIKLNNTHENYLYVNLMILQIILHEIEHANQLKNNEENTIEANLIRECNIIVETEESYLLSPKERFAEIKSSSEVNILLNRYDSNPRLQSVMELEELKRRFMGYSYNDCTLTIPTYKYFLIHDKEETYHNIRKQSNFNELYDRMFYGYEISLNEFSILLKEIIDSTNQYFKNNIRIIKKRKGEICQT